MPYMDRENCTSSGVYCPWPRPETLTWTRSRRQRDYIYSFCRGREDLGADRSLATAPREGRKRPIRIVASRRGLEMVSVAESARERFARVPMGWRLAGGIIVLLSVLELFLASHAPSAAAAPSLGDSALPAPRPVGEFGVTIPRFDTPRP